ncbi:MAG: hypothetical protein ACI9G1_003486 [Pirellulaceae bacterium]|jgi:hypothetical protein
MNLVRDIFLLSISVLFVHSNEFVDAEQLDSVQQFIVEKGLSFSSNDGRLTLDLFLPK